jgi:hypothetical protein
LAASVLTRDLFPREWLSVNTDLAEDYRVRIRGDHADNIDFAITIMTNALTSSLRGAFIQEWARGQNILGTLWFERARGSASERTLYLP